ncbi:MAG: SPOR domain-containing protein [Janthinobacterium lividum]
MAFFKFRSRGPKADEGRNAKLPTAPAESVDAMRRRARHRLAGAAILVLLGVIGFPLLFDTQPRPVAVDIPIEIPDRNKVAPLAIAPTAQSSTPGATGPNGRVAQVPAVPSTSAAPGNGGIITESQDGTEILSDRPVTTAQPRADATPRADTHVAVKPESRPKAEAKPEPKHESVKIAVVKPAAADDGARARALLDGKIAAAPPVASQPAAPAVIPAGDAGRFVIQVGAFADDAKAREVRQKLEKAGLKTFTNVAKTAEGERTRVRVGPFASRAEADRAAGKVKGLSLPAAVLNL